MITHMKKKTCIEPHCSSQSVNSEHFYNGFLVEDEELKPERSDHAIDPLLQYCSFPRNCLPALLTWSGVSSIFTEFPIWLTFLELDGNFGLICQPGPGPGPSPPLLLPPSKGSNPDKKGNWGGCCWSLHCWSNPKRDPMLVPPAKVVLPNWKLRSPVAVAAAERPPP